MVNMFKVLEEIVEQEGQSRSSWGSVDSLHLVEYLFTNRKGILKTYHRFDGSEGGDFGLIESNILKALEDVPQVPVLMAKLNSSQISGYYTLASPTITSLAPGDNVSAPKFGGDYGTPVSVALPPEQFIHYTAQILDFLERIDDRINYKDFKPNNIFFDVDTNQLTVIDFSGEYIHNGNPDTWVIQESTSRLLNLLFGGNRDYPSSSIEGSDRDSIASSEIRRNYGSILEEIDNMENVKQRSSRLLDLAKQVAINRGATSTEVNRWLRDAQDTIRMFSEEKQRYVQEVQDAGDISTERIHLGNAPKRYQVQREERNPQYSPKSPAEVSARTINEIRPLRIIEGFDPISFIDPLDYEGIPDNNIASLIFAGETLKVLGFNETGQRVSNYANRKPVREYEDITDRSAIGRANRTVDRKQSRGESWSIPGSVHGFRHYTFHTAHTSDYSSLQERFGELDKLVSEIHRVHESSDGNRADSDSQQIKDEAAGILVDNFLYNANSYSADVGAVRDGKQMFETMMEYLNQAKAVARDFQSQAHKVNVAAAKIYNKFVDFGAVNRRGGLQDLKNEYGTMARLVEKEMNLSQFRNLIAGAGTR